MKTETKKRDYVQELFKLLMVVGLIALLFAPAGAAAQARTGNALLQTDGINAPLSPDLAWNDLGSAERSFPVNGESVTLTGTVYGAAEEFNLEANDAVAAYYTSPSLAAIGWREVGNFPQTNGISTLYFKDGVFALVEFVGCQDNDALACLTVWGSGPTDLVPAESVQSSPVPQASAAFKKTSPANGAFNMATTVTMTWSAYSGTKFNHYRACLDTSDNGSCDSVGGWRSIWSGTSAAVSSLTPGTMYFWHVQAVLSDGTKVDSDLGEWFHFKTATVITPTPTLVPGPPGAFLKGLPANGAVSQSITPTLTWSASPNTGGYSYCVDTVNDNICNTNWVSNSASTFVSLLGGISPGITYYWQVRSTNSAGTVEANGGIWWSFTTSAGPANDAIGAAIAFAIPAQFTLNTASATIDSGTTNTCSASLGYASVWYKYASGATWKIYLDTFGSNYDTIISVWTHTPNLTLNPITCNDDSASTTQSSASFSATLGTTYYVQVLQKNPGTVPTVAPGGSLHFNVRTFSDVAANNAFWNYVEGVYAAGITSGCAISPDLLFCPSLSVTRAEMAVFLLRGIHGAAYAPPAVGASTGFTDVPTTHWAAAWIKELAAEGITSGCGVALFCPESYVTRAEMAVFLLRAEHTSAYTPPPATGSVFTDVPASSFAAAWIEQLFAEGITSGCTATTYCPTSNVTRDQMAVFLSRAFGIVPVP